MNFINETVVETKSCQKCQVSFDVTDKDLEFYDKISPVFDGKKYSIPTPMLCRECREQRRLSFRNERKMYKGSCDLSKKEIVSVYRPDTPYKIYSHDAWWSDNWDAMDYGIEYDAGVSFFTQWEQLFIKVPQLALLQVNLENSDYCNIVANSKDSYLVFASSKLDTCMYGVSLERCKYVFDSNLIKDSQYCYEGFMLNDCFDLYYSGRCNNCSDSVFLKECENCHHCLFCSDITNQKYQIWNKSVTKEEFEEQKREILSGNNDSLDSLRKKFNTWAAQIPKRSANIVNSQHSSGDNLINCEDVRDSFDCFEVEKSKNLIFSNFQVDHCFDCNYSGHTISFCYETHLGVFNASKLYFCNNIFSSRDMFYCTNCHDSSNLFGCIGLKHKSYCVFNKQYTKQQYEVLVPKIIAKMKQDKQWGEFFSSSLSPFGYNETVAAEYFPLDKKQAQEQGFNWTDYESPFPKVEKTIPASGLPDSIDDVPDDILNWAIECEVSKKPFMISSKELEFYKKHHLSIPRRHPDQRHLDRMGLRNPRKLFERECDSCGIEIQTTYTPERPEKVYCGDCYDTLVY